MTTERARDGAMTKFAQWDYVVAIADGRTGLITLDLGGMYRVRHHHGPTRPGRAIREATYSEYKLRPATDQERAAAIADGVTRDAERSGIKDRAR